MHINFSCFMIWMWIYSMMVFANETRAWAFPKLNFVSSEIDWAIVLIVFIVGSKPLCGIDSSLYKEKGNTSMAHAF